MNSEFDLIVIGSGSAATTAVFRVLEAGWKVAVVDQKPIGGTCALRGCDPKKVIFGVTSVLEYARRLDGSGIDLLQGKIDWPGLMEFKRTFTGPMSENIEKSLLDSGVSVFHGRADFLSSDTLKVENQVLTGKKILIASGVRAASFDFPGAGYLVDNETFMDLPKLPDRIAFVGGGYISVEFAGIARKAGSQTTIIQRSGRLLVNFDSDATAQLTKNLLDAGIEVKTGLTVDRIEKVNDEFAVYLSGKNGNEILKADLVVHGAGREFDGEMNLDRAGIQWSRNGIKVNEYLQSTTNNKIYSAGDSADTPGSKLTPVAVMEGRVAAENMVNGNHARPDYAGIPTTVFSTPPLAMVGITEDQAISANIDVKVRKGDMSSWYNSRRRNVGHSFFKILVENNTGSIVGAHILGENAEEVINIFSLAIRHKISGGQLASMPYSYPSDTNDIRYMLG